MISINAFVSLCAIELKEKQNGTVNNGDTNPSRDKQKSDGHAEDYFRAFFWHIYIDTDNLNFHVYCYLPK